MSIAEYNNVDNEPIGRECEDLDELVRGSGARSLTIKRVQHTTPDDEGGYLVQKPLVEAFNNALQFTGARVWARRFTTPTGADAKWPMSDDRANAAAIVSQPDATVPADIVYDVVATTPFLYTTAIINSIQFWSDRFDGGTGLGHLGDILGQRMRIGTDNDFLVGTGTAQPQGLFTGAIDAGNLTAANDPTADELETLEALVDGDYLLNAGWVMSPIALAAIRNLTPRQFDFSNGRHYIRGYPVYPTVKAPGIAFGDLRNYIVHDAGEVSISIVRDYAGALTNQELLIARYRSDGRCWVPATLGGVALVKSANP